MVAMQLSSKAVERVWGRTDIPIPGYGDGLPSEPIGELWFTDTGRNESELLVKHLFTSERLSIQVHPDDAAARARGYARGKDEAWFVVNAEPNASIGLGPTRVLSPAELRAAALDGEIEHLLDWKSVRAGDFFYSPAGTVHAIGAGLSVVEIQQNLDLTYRLYDYGRPRALHLDDGIAVADFVPWTPKFEPYDHDAGRRILAGGGAFVVERWTFPRSARIRSRDGQLQLMPLRNGGRVDDASLAAGTVWRIEGDAELDPGAGIDLLAAYPGAMVVEEICVFI